MYTSLAQAADYAKRFLDHYYRDDSLLSLDDINDGLIEEIFELTENQKITLSEKDQQIMEEIAEDNQKLDVFFSSKLDNYPSILTQSLKNYIFSCVDLENSSIG